jgi:hypothetical protein
MTSKTLILLSILNILTLTTHGQSRRQIGKSVWKVANEIVSKSIDHILEFDQNGKLKSEQKIFRDLKGFATDTVKAYYDDKGNLIKYHSTESRTTYITDYDSLKTQIKITTLGLNDTVISISNPIYIEVTDSSKRFKVDYDGTILNKYEMWTSDMKPLLMETKTEVDNKIKRVEILTWEYTTNGNVTEFIKTLNDKIVKKTNHLYKDNLETKRIEQYFSPDYTIITTYKHEYKTK